jgi:hypothetical protein
MPRKKSVSQKFPKKFAAREAIRVVPLHHPKWRFPSGKAGTLGETLIATQLQRAVAAELTYRGGPLIKAAQVFTIFWGKSWVNAADAKALVVPMNKFFGDILVSPLVDQLSEYNVSGQSIGHGGLIGSKVITAGAPTSSVSDSTIQTALKNWISSGTVPSNNSNRLYFIFLEPGIVSVMGGSRSCQSYCGYHNNVGSVYYAVMPYPGCSGCLGGLAALDALTATSSHELCEAITDPVPGTGWYDDTQGEIGDICAWQFKQVRGYTVQLEWSNKQNKCV